MPPGFDTRIETERLLLRPFTMEDVDASHAMNLDPEVSRYTGDGGVQPKEEIERRIREDVLGDYTKHGYGRFAVELRSSNEFIGFCGLKYLPDMDEVDLGYRFLSKYWGRGYATESCRASLEFGFKTLNLKRIIALVLPENKASIRVLQKCGFSFDGYVEEDGMRVMKYLITLSKYGKKQG